MERKKTKRISVGNTYMGGDSDITVQSMLNAKSYDVEANVCQAKELEQAGCEIIRVSVPTLESVKLIYELKKNLKIPVVADIHFNYKIAVESVIAGADKIRINPGNIGGEEKIKIVADTCRNKGVPIRVGVNSGSLEKDILEKYGGPTPEAMCESALYNVSLLEKFDFSNIVISAKSSSTFDTVKIYRMISERCDYPLHLGITESGTERMGMLKSAAGIGSLLLDGIGDTIRISLTADPVKEVHMGIDLLKALKLRKSIDIVSCPTCGRTRIDVIKFANKLEEKLKNCDKNLKIAVMGCVVNGPGEAADADIGISGGNGIGIIFKKGKEIKRLPESEIFDELISQIDKM